MSLAALDNLVRVGRLKTEPCNMAEVERMLGMGETRIIDPRLPHLFARGALPVPTMPRMRRHWRLCDGMVTAAKIALLFFSVLPIPLAGRRPVGGYWI